FWTVGDTLTMTSTSADERVYQMVMSKGDPRYVVKPRRVLFAERGTELKIRPLLEGIRGLSGEKIQWYLASELRDRIRNTQVRVTVLDKLARKQYQVEPRQFEGRLLHQLPTVRSPFGEAYGEPYLTEPEEEQASRESLRAIQRAFREAMLVLPREEYDWFDIQSRSPQASGAGEPPGRDVEASGVEGEGGVPEPRGGEPIQRQFFDYAGPLHTVVISPAASTLA